MCAAIDGFRARYGIWPQRVRTPKDAITPLFMEATLSKINELVTVVEDGSTFIAEDDLGRRYNYAEEGFTMEMPDINARQWLDVGPDSQMVREDYNSPHRIKPDDEE
jgi:hypothetical protein